MTSNLYLTQSLIEDRTRSLSQADSHRWPEVARAERLRAARHTDDDLALLRRRRTSVDPHPRVPTQPGHRWLAVLHGLAVGRRVAQR